MKIIPEAVKSEAISLLIEGLSERDIALRLNISNATVNNIHKANITDISNNKKEIKETSLKSNQSKLTNIANKMIDIAGECQTNITNKKLKDCSAPQIATTLGIVIDKYNILTGNATQVMEVKFKDRNSMVDFIKGNKPVESVKIAHIPQQSETHTTSSAEYAIDKSGNVIKSMSARDIKKQEAVELNQSTPGSSEKPKDKVSEPVKSIKKGRRGRPRKAKRESGK